MCSSDKKFAEGRTANENGDQFDLTGVLVTVSLFFAGLGLVFKSDVRWAFFGLGTSSAPRFSPFPGPVRADQPRESLILSNSGEAPAGDLSLRLLETPGLEVAFARADGAPLSVDRSTSSGETIVRIGSLAPGATVVVELGMLVTGGVGERVALQAAARTSAWLDGRPAPWASTEAHISAQAVTPPVIQSARAAGASDTFSVKLVGSGFAAGARIFIGADAIPWTKAKVKKGAAVTIKGGAALAAKFPLGKAVVVRVVNADGGEAAVFVTR